jgi:Tfp pilus assembly protein PilX
MKQRGFTLLAVLAFAGLWLALSLAGASIISQVRQRVAHNKMDQAAAACARSGVAYAQEMLAQGRWHGNETFTSPDLDGTGCFTVTLHPDTHGTLVRSVGQAGRAAKTVEQNIP